VHPVATSNASTLDSCEARSVPNTTKRGWRFSAAVAVPRSLAHSLRACHKWHDRARCLDADHCPPAA
jgi:hypothetical protein